MNCYRRNDEEKEKYNTYGTWDEEKKKKEGHFLLKVWDTTVRWLWEVKFEFGFVNHPIVLWKSNEN